MQACKNFSITDIRQFHAPTCCLILSGIRNHCIAICQQIVPVCIRK